MKDIKKQFKESVLSRAARLRPIDIHRASNGMISKTEAGRWLSGRVSKGALFAIQLLCEKIEAGYEVPSVDRKERSDKGVPRRVDIVWDGQKAKVEPNPDGKYIMGVVGKHGTPKFDHSDEFTIPGQRVKNFDNIEYQDEEKMVLDLHPATGEWQDWMEWCRWSHGGAEFFGADGEAGFAMRVGDHTHVRINGSVYVISKFNRR